MNILTIKSKKLLLVLFCAVLWTGGIHPNIFKNVIETIVETSKATASTMAETGLALKANTWDASIGKSKHAGKILMTIAGTVTLADQLYAKRVNKEINQEIDAMFNLLTNKKDGATQDEIDAYNALYAKKYKTISERIKNQWYSINPKTREMIGQIAITVTASLLINAITMKMNNRMITSKLAAENLSNVNIEFKDIIGADRAKQLLERWNKYHENPEPFNKVGVTPGSAMIMSGPPGTGKTEFARAAAKESGAEFYSLTGSDFNRENRGSGSSLLDAINDLSKNSSERIIVFIDEADSMMSKHNKLNACSADDQATTNKLKTLLDGFTPKHNIFFMFATNNIHTIDPAILRDGRAEIVEFTVPNKQGISDIFNNILYSRGMAAEPNIDIKDFVDNAIKIGATGASLFKHIKEAGLRAVDNHRLKITSDDLYQTMPK